MGYPGPQALPKPPGERPIKPLDPPAADAPVSLEADVVIVGSGAGGGVIAGELAAAGKKVCVVEMGGYYDESDFLGLELPAYQQLYLNGGPFPTADGQIGLQAGSSLGGGTVLNWTNCLRTHPWVREQWANEHGLEGLDGPDYDAHLDAVSARISANDGCSDLNGPHQRLKEGCEALGLDFKLTVRNTDPETYDPVTAGYMGFGEQSGSKQSTQKTYLADAAANGAEILVNCRVERVLVENGRAAGVEGVWTREDGTHRRRSSSARRRSSSPAARSSRPRCCCARGSAAPRPATTCACIPPPRSSASTRRTRIPGGARRRPGSRTASRTSRTATATCSSARSTRPACTAPRCPGTPAPSTRRRCSSSAAAARSSRVTRDRGHGRVTIDDRGRAVPTYPLDRRARRPPPPRRLRADGAAARGGRRARSSWRSGARPRPGAAATTSRPSSRRSARRRWRRARWRCSAPTRWAAAGWATDPATQRRRPLGRAARHPRGLDRRRERVPDRVGHEPDADDHGPRTADGARDRGGGLGVPG